MMSFGERLRTFLIGLMLGIAVLMVWSTLRKMGAAGSSQQNQTPTQQDGAPEPAEDAARYDGADEARRDASDER